MPSRSAGDRTHGTEVIWIMNATLRSCTLVAQSLVLQEMVLSPARNPLRSCGSDAFLSEDSRMIQKYCISAAALVREGIKKRLGLTLFCLSSLKNYTVMVICQDMHVARGRW